MRAKLIFNLPEDEHEFKTALRGADYQLALWDLYSYFRGQVKHLEPDQRDDIETVQQKFFEIMESRGVDVE